MDAIPCGRASLLSLYCTIQRGPRLTDGLPALTLLCACRPYVGLRSANPGFCCCGGVWICSGSGGLCARQLRFGAGPANLRLAEPSLSVAQFCLSSALLSFALLECVIRIATRACEVAPRGFVRCDHREREAADAGAGPCQGIAAAVDLIHLSGGSRGVSGPWSSPGENAHRELSRIASSRLPPDERRYQCGP